MNTPYGNSITTAEHAIALLLALARELPAANASTQAGKWEKNRFMGVEITGKVLGLIGAGNIGSIVADRARGLKMRVVAFDPYLSPERAVELGMEKVELNELLARADFITLHVPLTAEPGTSFPPTAIAKTKKGVRIINCARGGLIDEHALKAAMDNGHVAGAALDVFETEPAKENILFGSEQTGGDAASGSLPHIEAQENVALQVAGAGANLSSRRRCHQRTQHAIDLRALKPRSDQPWIALAEKLGSFAGQLTEHCPCRRWRSSMKARRPITQCREPMTQAALARACCSRMLTGVNLVNAPLVIKVASAASRLSETRRDSPGHL